MYIGSHVKVAAPDYLLASVKEAISYDANAMMIYTGAPTNSKRIPLEKFKIDQALELMQKHDISIEHLIVHAPYLINLANCTKEETFELGVALLKQEIERTKQIGAKIIVLHPGSHLKEGSEKGIKRICEGLDLAMNEIDDCIIALETMAGKGSECGVNFTEIKTIIDNCTKKDSLGVCLDTCHVHDAGYDLSKFDELLDEFDRIIGLEHLKVIHLNDSKNICGARKDRHANLGYGEIGFDILCQIAHHPRLKNVVKILETPYVDGKAPYKKEIEMLRNQRFENDFLEKI